MRYMAYGNAVMWSTGFDHNLSEIIEAMCRMGIRGRSLRNSTEYLADYSNTSSSLSHYDAWYGCTNHDQQYQHVMEPRSPGWLFLEHGTNVSGGTVRRLIAIDIRPCDSLPQIIFHDDFLG